MNTPLSRRTFLGKSALLGASIASAARVVAANAPSNKLRVGVMGLGRGKSHIKAYCALPNVELVYVCDVDKHKLDAGVALAKKHGATSVQGVGDFRRIIDDPTIDAISIAAPNFWHTPATILACAAGKHVYVEKPGSYSPQEAEWIVAAARKHKRVVQMGAQRRSNVYFQEAYAQLHAGVIGEPKFSKCWLGKARASVGHVDAGPVPDYLDYALWQGPTPERPYHSNIVRNWHLFWHWGGGEMANSGPHMLDLARWGLGVDYPTRVTCGGDRYGFRDDEQTPDTATATYEFEGKKGIAFEWSGWHTRSAEPIPICSFYGDGGSLLLNQESYSIHDFHGKKIGGGAGTFDDVAHFRNFVETIRGNDTLKLDIADGQITTMLCHLGNIAYRAGETINFDPKAKKMVGASAAAQKYWTREYRPGWQPQV